MKSYWIKITLGAIGIFAIGMVIVTAINAAKRQVVNITETSNPLTIPFPFGMVPFKLDGAKLGTVEQLTLIRDTPKGISNVRLMVKLTDSGQAAKLAQCLLVVDDVQNLNDRTTFRCQNSDTAGLNLVHYGDVSLEGVEGVFPLLLPQEAVEDLRSEGANQELEARVDSISEAASALADSITEVNMERADSIRDAAMAKADSIRDEAFRMADSVRASKMVERAPEAPRPPRPRPRP